MTRGERGTGTEAVQRRPWPPLVLATAVVAAGLVLLASVAAAAVTVTGTAGKAGPGKPVATATATTPTRPPAQPSPTPTVSATPKPTATPTSGVCPLGYETHAGRQWCRADILEVVLDVHPDGLPVVMAGFVEESTGSSVALVGGAACLAQLYGQPVFCGAMTSGIQVEFGSTPVPGYGAVVDVYGLAAPAGTIAPLEIAVRP
jgi:hypothetical protein